MANKLTLGARRVRELAEEANRRNLHTERDLMREVTEILTAAKWTIHDQARNPPRRFGGDMLASRTELGQERRYALDFVVEVNGEKARERQAAFRNYIQQSKQPFQDFDEFWVVGYSVADPMRRNPGNDRHFRVISLEELRALLAPPKSKRSGKAVTKIGKAIEANEKSILLAIEGLKLQIGDRIAKLRDERPNDPDAIKKVDASIAGFEEMQAGLEHIKVAVQQFKKNEVKEKAVVESVHSFKGSLGKWWNKSHDTIYTSASNSAIFIGAAGLLHTIGLDNGAALAIVGSFIGGETVAKVLKSLPRGLFTKQS
ncbi:hypothetical protein [Tardiphaga sp.]|uniref:hypothetical protein n=1 Tax=Tardiphaga sp. TaxID=1926292 RepID=UPI00352AB21B